MRRYIGRQEDSDSLFSENEGHVGVGYLEMSADTRCLVLCRLLAVGLSLLVHVIFLVFSFPLPFQLCVRQKLPPCRKACVILGGGVVVFIIIILVSIIIYHTYNTLLTLFSDDVQYQCRGLSS